MKFMLPLLGLLLPSVTLAWGGRGHHVICSTAVHLVQEEGLKDFLHRRPHIMGHLCNVPDIYWKSLPPAVAKPGDAAHFIDPEVTGLPIRKIGLDFSGLEKTFTGQPNRFKPGATIVSLADDLGSSWWRADQFFRRVISRKEAFANTTPPQRHQEQDDAFPYNAEIYNMMVNMGLLGHFVGDASQPLHNSADYDGYRAGHGGLHAYYEETTVAEAPGNLEARVLAEAEGIRSAPWLTVAGVPAKMREFSAIAFEEIPRVYARDPVKKKSTVRDENGLQLKEAAVREPARVGWKKFEPLIIRQMARSARLLAHLWDRMYVEAGQPNLQKYRSYRYPFTPEFVPLDYVRVSP